MAPAARVSPMTSAAIFAKRRGTCLRSAARVSSVLFIVDSLGPQGPSLGAGVARQIGGQGGEFAIADLGLAELWHDGHAMAHHERDIGRRQIGPFGDGAGGAAAAGI